jgi:hypothetical protein
MNRGSGCVKTDNGQGEKDTVMTVAETEREERGEDKQSGVQKRE